VTIRVLHIVESFGFTGAGRQVALLARGLPRDDIEVHVCGLGLGGPLGDELARAGVPTTTLARRWRFDPSAMWRLRRQIAALRPQVVHTWQFSANTYGRLTCGNGSHLVATERRTELWKRWPEEGLDRWLQPRAQRFLATSAAVRNFCLLRRGLPRPGSIEVVPPGVASGDRGTHGPKREHQAPRDSLRKELELPDEAKLVVAVGSLTHSRRVKDMVWAMELLGVVIPELHLLVIGDGPQRRSLERYAADFRHAARMHFLGSRDARELWPQVDVLWSPGEEDGPPLATLEAMAAGVPVVASDTPGNREVITPGQNGLLFPLGDRPGLTRCTLRLLQDDEMAKHFGRAGREHVQRHFTAGQLIERHAKMYRELAA
jgi:glycosyltransferase involved in cell wall biosynthesis